MERVPQSLGEHRDVVRMVAESRAPELASLTVGARCEINIFGFPSTQYPGRLTSIRREVDSNGNAPKYQLEISLESWPDDLKLGSTGAVALFTVDKLNRNRVDSEYATPQASQGENVENR